MRWTCRCAPTQFLHRCEVGERSADHAGADKRDLLASHKTSPIAITSGTRMVTRSARLRSSLRPIRKLGQHLPKRRRRSEEHTSELQSLMRISYAVFCLKKKNKTPIK